MNTAVNLYVHVTITNHNIQHSDQ